MYVEMDISLKRDNQAFVPSGGHQHPAPEPPSLGTSPRLTGAGANAKPTRPRAHAGPIQTQPCSRLLAIAPSPIDRTTSRAADFVRSERMSCASRRAESVTTRAASRARLDTGESREIHARLCSPGEVFLGSCSARAPG